MQMNNDSYLQDFYNYNQMPNNFNPFMNSPCMQNPNMMQNQCGMMNGMGGMNGNSNMFQPNNSSNLTSFYPSTYRIINPVVSRVVQNCNYQFLNEDTLNNMVDTVFSIVDGQIDFGEEEMPLQNQSQTGSSATQSTTSQTQRTTVQDAPQRMQSNTIQNSRSNSLLRDIIRILIIKELLSRRNNPFMNY